RYKRYGLYRDLTWEQYRADALACAAALVQAGMQPGDRVGLLAENRLEWLIADVGILMAGAVNVPPHAPLTAKQVHFQLADAGVTWLFVSNIEQRNKIRQIEQELPQLKGLVAFDRTAAGPRRAGWTEYTWDGFVQRGRQALGRVAAELDRRDRALNADSLATIIYTSGTTGIPKGVML